MSVAATNVSGMDHTGDYTADSAGDTAADGCQDGPCQSRPDAPIESGQRSDALLAELADAERERVRAEARVSRLMTQIDDARSAEASKHTDPHVRSLEASSAADDISLTLGLPAGMVMGRLSEFSLTRTHLPQVWARHLSGHVDGWRLRVIADLAADLQDPANVTILDEKLPSWLDARPRTPGQLRAWLHRQIARLEPDQHHKRQELAWKQRYARITHDHADGTAQLFTVLSGADGIAIQDLIDQRARDRAHDAAGVTVQQACADVIADILLGRISVDGATGTSRVQARIGVLVPIATLAGLSDEPGTTIDRQSAFDAPTVRALAALPGTLFRRLLTDDSGNNLLEVTSGSYRASDALREAIAWRDGTCAFPTCQRPTNTCDLDHVQPWPQGATTAGNLQYLCRRHHRLKSHGLLPTRDPT